MVNLNIAALFVDSQLLIIRFTPQISKILNITIRDINSPLSNFSTNLDYPIEELIKNLYKVKETLIPFDKTLKSKSGNWYQMKIFPYRTVINKIEGLVISFFDISVLKKSEIKYIEAYNTADFYKNLFLHDISNIFQVILSSNDLIINNKDTYSKEELLAQNEIINVALDRGLKLIKNLQKLSIDEEFPFLKALNPIDHLKTSIKAIKESYKNEQLEIKLNIDLKELVIKGDALLSDIFDNILINAIVHNQSKKKMIEIQVSRITEDDKAYFRFEFNDNGLGISDQKKKKVFDFFAPSLKNLNEVGIGLSLVKKIVARYNGKIWVEDKIKNDPSKGSRFIVLLPEAIEF
ncbi:MAG: PAS domain-containing protein [Promethearchaeota archaeon]